jgi:predicted SPOUT superfamily RNA methylase MTH1
LLVLAALAPTLFQLAGQIARAATVFRIDEVVVFDSNSSVENSGDDVESGARFLVRILQYLETPQYLRRRLFPMHNNLKFVVRPLKNMIASSACWVSWRC